jgi:hypothetical protein
VTGAPVVLAREACPRGAVRQNSILDVRQNWRGTVRKLIISTLVAASVSTVTWAVGPPVDFEASASVYFSSDSKADRIRATLRGKNCASATFELTIISKSAGRLFQRAIPMERVFPCDYYDLNPEGGRSSAASFVNMAISVRKSNNLACTPDAMEFGCWESPVLDRLREYSTSVVCFKTYRERKSCVAFDPQEGKVVEVLRYG